MIKAKVLRVICTDDVMVSEAKFSGGDGWGESTCDFMVQTSEGWIVVGWEDRVDHGDHCSGGYCSLLGVPSVSPALRKKIAAARINLRRPPKQVAAKLARLAL